MPTVTIVAFSKDKLPAPTTLTTWLDNWSTTAGGTWTGPLTNPHHDNRVSFDVSGLTEQQVENTVDPTIDSYNSTHTGNDEITVIVC